MITPSSFRIPYQCFLFALLFKAVIFHCVRPNALTANMLLFINKFIIFSILTIRGKFQINSIIQGSKWYYLFYFSPACNCLGCFVCNSVNGSNSLCEDPFNNFNDTFYEENCKAGIPGRIGIYPSTDCVKIKGTYGLYPNKFDFLIPIDKLWISKLEGTLRPFATNRPKLN